MPTGSIKMRKHGKNETVRDVRERDRLLEEAAEWRARLDSGEVSVEAFEHWRQADTQHAVAFARIARTWRDIGDLTPVQVSNLETLMMRERATPAARPPSALWSRRAAALALLGIGVAGGAVYWNRESDPLHHETIGIGERRVMSFADRIKVDINTGSVVYWRESGKHLDIWLKKGELALGVQSGGLQPKLFVGDYTFLPEIGQMNARMTIGSLNMAVIKGAVTVLDRLGKTLSVIGERNRAIITPASISISPASALYLEGLEAWRNGIILFRDTPLSEAVAEFNRYLIRKIFITDRSLAGLRIGGRFMANDPDTFLSAVALAFPVKVERNDRAIILASQ